MDGIKNTKEIEVNNKLEINELAMQTPIGWSSACLDQTISYYIDCNSTNITEEETFININKELP